MAERLDTMMDPPVEELLGRCHSKFSLVTLASKRARQINSYYGHLGDGTGQIVPPQVTSTARKPLSIAFEEIAADKIEGITVDLGRRGTGAGRSGRARGVRRRRRLIPPRTMDALRGRRVVLGVCGGIAAYKAVEVCRRLVDAGAHVVPVMTDGATRFVGEVTFTALASEPVRPSLWDEPDPIPHTRLGQDADLVLVAPATARLLSAYAAGYSHDLLDQRAAGDPGAGRGLSRDAHRDVGAPGGAGQPRAAASPRRARRAARGGSPRRRRRRRGSAGRPGDDRRRGGRRARRRRPATRRGRACRVLVTAGGTREPIDPVRFIGNRSSGKQGHAIAEEAAATGAAVTLVTTTTLAGARGDRAGAGGDRGPDARRRCDGRAASPTSSSWRQRSPTSPRCTSPRRRSRSATASPWSSCEPTVDILAELGARKAPGPDAGRLRGRDDRRRGARRGEARGQAGRPARRQRRRRRPGVGFEHDTNEVLILHPDGHQHHVPLSDKRSVARAVLDAVAGIRSTDSTQTGR